MQQGSDCDSVVERKVWTSGNGRSVSRWTIGVTVLPVRKVHERCTGFANPARYSE
jgi:hypothetical protein